MTTICISMKHNDLADIEYIDGKFVIEHDGYMPHVGIFGGDYTNLKIDNETGTIIGWKTIDPEQLIEAIRNA